MNILIVGKSGLGKSNLGDIVKNTIFKMDGNATINTNDPDRAVKAFGTGSNVYNINIKQLAEGVSIKDLAKEAIEEYDIIIDINNKAFLEWFREIYSQAHVG